MLELADSSLERFMLDMLDLSLEAFMQTSSKILLSSLELDIAKVVEKVFLFAISLLGTTIQDGGIEERSG